MKRAFTIIELLVVIAIIAILAAILFPVFATAREKARQTNCASNLKQCAIGILQYAQDYDECMPCGGHYGWDNAARTCITNSWPGMPLYYVWNITGSGGDPMWMGLIYPYTRSTGIYYCLSGPTGVESNPGFWNSGNTSKPGNTNFAYAYNQYVLPTAYWETGNTIDASCGVLKPTSAAPSTQLSQFTSASQIYMLMDRGQYDRASGVNIAGSNPKGTTSGAGSDSLTNATGHNPATRHNDGAQFAFADGHVKMLSYSQYVALKPSIINGGIYY
ncbi:MAG TPA: DUF1559 domain-containing protein [Capsulimonadaceae bacterium]|jgi:prepilin-type N-terminal cleavage/methylation domain-containing protein/prepilin-type processing-associated H-X9-DG protein